MTIDEILDEYDYKLHSLDRDEIKSALYDLILKEVVESDEEFYRPYLVASTKLSIAHNQTQARGVLRGRNNLRAEQRNKLKELFDD